MLLVVYRMSRDHVMLVITVWKARVFQTHEIILLGMFVLVVIIARSELETRSNVQSEHFPAHSKIRMLATANIAQSVITVDHWAYLHLLGNVTVAIIVPPGNFPNDLQNSGVHLDITVPMVAQVNARVSQAAIKMNMVNGSVKNVLLDSIVIPAF